MKLSIITINYNNSVGLQKTIDSVIAQTWRDFEWIVIDGGSTDGSKELIVKYQNHFAYWCSEPDKGIYNAMNKGVAKAKGEYCLFLNSGDALFSSLTLANVFSKNLSADLISGMVVREDNGKFRRGYHNSLVRQLITDTIEHQGTFIKNSLFHSYRYHEDYKIVSDWVAWIEWVLVSNCSFEYIDDIVAVQETDGISATQLDLLNRERKRALRTYFNERIIIELENLYKSNDFLQKNVRHPAINGLLYLLSRKSLWFSLLYRLVIASVIIHDFFIRDYSYKKFVRENQF